MAERMRSCLHILLKIGFIAFAEGRYGERMVKSWSIAREDRLLKENYPAAAKRLLPFAEDECQRMEYEGSRMYDEIPDRLMMRKTAERICSRAYEQPEEGYASPVQTDNRSGKAPEELFIDDEIFATDFRGSGQQAAADEALLDLAQVLLYHELFLRRCERHMRNK